MPANNQRPATQTPVSPRNTAKYTNKDGSKFITVPKGTPSESSLPPTPTSAKPNGPPLDVSNVDDGPAPAVNRKKQKRRQKAAAKAAAQQAANGNNNHASGRGAAGSSMTGRDPADHEEVESDDENEYVLASELTEPTTNGHPPSDSRSKKNRKKKKKGTNADPTSPIPEALEHEPQPNLSQGAGMSRDKIWSTSNQEERERIKAFWLGLGEDERKSLVKVEKDAVLKKMKEQQKHTCSCTVCGRKRTAIEEELEGLYDAYYLELEQFANQGEGPPMLPSARDFALRRAIPSTYTNRPPSRGRIVEQLGDEEDDEEEDELEEVYSEDEVEDDDYSDDEPPEEFQTSHERDVADFLTFGNSLQVKGGILTVADDLLKNDGKRFIEMMEQLAERRMAREEDAREHFSRGYGHPNGSYSNPHNHPPPEEDEYDEEEDEEEDYDDSQDEEYEEEEDQMTEEQRMEEGRRMFQIFAARMFEQRVLSAYKEKVAKERQQRLLEEIEAEDRESELKKAKKAKDAQKKKDKAAQKKQALAEERARKEAEKAAADAARLEAERQRVAEQKARAEEKRKQKEAQKKAEEEARLRKEAERQRRLHEQREKQAEQERKARETKEKEKKLKEEQRQRDKEAREQKEREAQERKDKQERDKRDKEARAAKAQKDAQAAREAKEKLREEKAAAQKAASHPSQPIQIPKRASQHSAPIPTALPQHASNPASYASPKIPVATPVLSKAPTPIRPRNTSQQQDVLLPSATVSSNSQDPSPHSMTPHMSPGPIGQRHGSASTQHSHSVSPTNGQSRMLGQSPFQIPPMGMQPPPGLAHHPPPPGFANRMPHEAIFSGFRHSPGAMMPPPGINGPPGRGFSVPLPPGFTQPIGDQFDMGGFPLPTDLPPPTHHRQSSLQFDTPPTPSQPIGRPAPIGRPGSLSQSRASDDQDDETAILGSRALLEDDEPLTAEVNPGSLRNQPPGPRGDFTTSPFLPSAFPLAHNPWGPPAVGGHPLPPPGFNNPGWGAPSVPPGFGMTSPIAGMSSIRAPAQPRYVTVRAMLCQACKELASSGDSEGYIDIGTLKSRIDAMSGDHSISELDLLNLCETEGSPSNGGGTFDIRRDAAGPGKHTVRWEPDLNDGFGAPYRAVGAPGEIGSPLVGQATLRGGL
ncbi:Stress response protein nst1 [Fusarium poae]|uniref:hypothetical protein n=1 Tax=Fusarium poae TaxID=36050 RepID=UPI001CE812A9|nr:hypothetical protein FPOAC1_006509 [Fusarium poae]KAG8673202.1 hypothetical protein FPOAC1_006509 [Fusarium poae]